MLRVISRTTPLITESVLRKTLSLSACSPKRFVIKDHFDFDKKVVQDLEIAELRLIFTTYCIRFRSSIRIMQL